LKQRLGKYELLKHLGTGAMASVWHARDTLLGRECALKIISEELLHGSDTARERFIQEGRLSARLDHPNIVAVYELGIEGDRPFIAMEYLPGIDLVDLLERRQPSLRAAVHIALQVARALEHAHGRGVIHRDVKPANIRILRGGRVKLVDFGIAMLVDEGLMRLTQSGIVVGSVSYLSPEQLRNHKPGRASDVFTFGLVLYELLTGRHPFDAETLHDVVCKVLEEPPPPIRNPQVPAELRALAACCLEKPLERRFGSFEPIVQGLDRVQRRLASGPAAALEPSSGGHEQPDEAFEKTVLLDPGLLAPAAGAAPAAEPPHQPRSGAGPRKTSLRRLWSLLPRPRQARGEGG
jgi:eukaryotic-like serine/threonine-protein kinase